MSFEKPYLFKKNNTVVIQHKGGGEFKHFLRVKPNAEGDADPNGGKGQFAQWETELSDGGSKIKIKSTKSGKYLRIHNDDIDVGGGGGKFTVFKVHQLGTPGHVKLESVEHPGKYIAVQKDNVIRIGNGGQWTELRFFREDGDDNGDFTKPYLFKKTNTVVLKHKLGKYLRVKPNSEGDLDPNGGKGEYAQWEADPQDGGSKVRFKSLKTGKYLRIHNDDINVGGGGGKFTVFKVHQQGTPGHVKLESVEYPGKYIAVQKDNVIRIGKGGQWTYLEIYRKD